MRTKYSMVKEHVLSKILDGTYKANEKISSESELMEQFGVSRHTVRLAIGDLVTEGWLYRKQGAGTFCAERQDPTRARQTKNIAIVVTYISDYIFPSIIRGAESYLSREGYQVSLFSTNNNHEREKEVLESILQQNFDGLIIEPTKSAITNPNINYYINIESKGIPYVMINAYYEELDPLSLSVNDVKGGFLQTDHLIKLNHKDIIGVFKEDDLQGIRRMKGFINAHRENRINLNADNIITFNSSNRETKPREELRRILSRNRIPTAIVSYNDQIALYLLDVIREKNLQVPEDISIVGFDDSFLAEVSEVKLTTVTHPQSTMGMRSAEMILQLTNKPMDKLMNHEMESVIYEPKLIVRESTAQNNK